MLNPGVNAERISFLHANTHTHIHKRVRPACLFFWKQAFCLFPSETSALSSLYRARFKDLRSPASGACFTRSQTHSCPPTSCNRPSSPKRHHGLLMLPRLLASCVMTRLSASSCARSTSNASHDCKIPSRANCFLALHKGPVSPLCLQKKKNSKGKKTPAWRFNSCRHDAKQMHSSVR